MESSILPECEGMLGKKVDVSITQTNKVDIDSCRAKHTDTDMHSVDAFTVQCIVDNFMLTCLVLN